MENHIASSSQKIFKIIVVGSFIIQLLIILSISWIFSSDILLDFGIDDNIFFYTNFYCIVLSTIILFGFLRQEIYIKSKICFVLLDIILAFTIAADSYSWIFDGKIEYKNLSILCFTIYHIFIGIVDYLFWFFIEFTYNENCIKNTKFERKIVHILLLFSFLFPIINVFTGFGTYVDISGYICDRIPQSILLHLPSLILTLMIFRSIICVKTTGFEKIILLSYIFVPTFFYIIGIYNYFNVNFYYPLLFAVYIFIFCNIVIARERKSLQNEIILAEKNRELNIASNIQKNMLPNNSEDYEKNGIDIFAHLNPAKEVGGDFYDYFMIDEDRLAVVVADVSEKGVPASLFMSIGKVLIEKAIKEEKTLPKALNSVHKTIINNNKKGIFITLFVAIIDLKNNQMTYTNAGHCLPLIKKNGEEFRYLDEIHGTFIGCSIYKSIEYGESTIEFNKGDILCLYTDGVTEAQNRDEKLFGEERLLNSVNNIESYDTSKCIIDHIVSEVKTFVGGYQQFDDITLLCVKRLGN